MARPSTITTAAELVRLGGAVDAPPPLSATQVEVQRAGNLSGDLHGVIERLESRLAPIVRAQPPEAAGKDSTGPCAPTELSRMLQSLNGSNEAAIVRLSKLADSIDL